MVLHDHDRRESARARAELVHGFLHDSSQDVSGLDEGHPDSDVREEAVEGLAAALSACQAVDEGRMRMEDVGLREEAVHEGLHGGPLRLAWRAREHEIGEHGGFALVGTRGVGLGPYRVELVSIHLAEAGLLDGAEGRPRGLHVEPPAVLEGGVAASRQDPVRIGAVAARYFD